MHILYKLQLRNCFAFLQKREKNAYKIGNSPKCTTLYKVQLRELFLQNAHMIIQSAIERIFSHFSKKEIWNSPKCTHDAKCNWENFFLILAQKKKKNSHKINLKLFKTSSNLSKTILYYANNHYCKFCYTLFKLKDLVHGSPKCTSAKWRMHFER